MADTGAPYFIPYVEPTDLVRDYPAADEAQADAIAAALDAIPVLAGIGSNVVQTVKTNVFATDSSTYVDVTGLTVTITPSSATSKILVVAFVSHGQLGGNPRFAWAVTRGTTVLAPSDDFDATYQTLGFSRADEMRSFSPIILDSPATTSVVDYRIRVRKVAGVAGPVRVNQDASGQIRGVSTITAIEVAA